MRRAFGALAVIISGLLLAPAAARADTPPARVALIGVPGLHWDDVTAADTPHLWRLAGQSALGSLSVRAVGRTTCPYDGWLTVSAGVRSSVGSRCGPPPPAEQRDAGAVIPDFNWLWTVRDVQFAGTLGEAVHAAGQCTSAVGPGAVLALADRSGRVDRYASSPDKVTDWSACRVLAVDVDDLIRPYIQDERLAEVPDKLSSAQRKAALKAADAKAGAVLAQLPPDTAVAVAGLADHGSEPHLRAAMWRAPGAEGRLLGARSTQRDDMVILPDITASMLATAGLAVPPTVIGTPWSPGRPTSLDDAVTSLRRADLAGQTIRAVGGLFFTLLAVAQVAFYAVAFLLLRRRRGLESVRVAALGLASVPVSTYLINLTPWDAAPLPALTLVSGILLCTAALTSLALAVPALWARLRGRPRAASVLGPSSVVAAVTAAVLLGDLLTGTPLQLDSVMGYTGVVGARYYGLGNIPFALLATAVLLVATAVADRLVRTGRRPWAVALVAGLGGFAMILDGWPGVGSDFGGVIAFVPGIAVTALLVAGKRVSVLKLGAFCVAGGVLVLAIAYLDHLRPPGSQTHLGRFVGQVLDGTFLPVILRKLTAMLSTLLSPNLMPIVLAAFAFLVFALLRPGAASAGVLPVAFERAPTLRAGLVGTLVSGVVGMLVNDSGAAVLSMALALAVPLVLSAGIAALAPGDPARPKPVLDPLPT
ncbi:hypothetical protein Skr01_55460 [Sphaerisporangium krabiense]|uniref:Uncharacterized protein n=1 Tax=Sphaerisporangium krabiense TaxID=763782 RepID=A0A7W8ZBG6_9ACTN|nr:hypothetical protein [Sphaerisporangium krabiense]MBB5630855.1 hypothetical protein [Sphaerisporangium krabiense]GII65461.1 hypothetical protein Skr01_55460 [Sphaerisporangium krabiense]